MAITPKYRLSASVIESDRATLRALKDLSDYTPINAEYSVERLSELDAILARCEQVERNARIALAVACEQAMVAEWELHIAGQGAKTQVMAQYGNDSFAVQAIGLKRKSDRRRPSRRQSATPRA